MFITQRNKVREIDRPTQHVLALRNFVRRTSYFVSALRINHVGNFKSMEFTLQASSFKHVFTALLIRKRKEKENPFHNYLRT